MMLFDVYIQRQDCYFLNNTSKNKKADSLNSIENNLQSDF